MSLNKKFITLKANLFQSRMARFGIVIVASGLCIFGSIGAHALYQQIYPEITTRSSTLTVSLPFTSSTVETDTLDSGVTQVQTKGVEGKKLQTWTMTYKNDIQTSKTLSSEKVTLAPVNEVILKGTRIPQAPVASAPMPSQALPTISSSSHESECKTKMLGAASIYASNANANETAAASSISSMALHGVPHSSISNSYFQAVSSLASMWQTYASGLTIFTDSNYVACNPVIFAQEVFMPAESTLAP